jgi:hypothetical protein
MYTRVLSEIKFSTPVPDQKLQRDSRLDEARKCRLSFIVIQSERGIGS